MRPLDGSKARTRFGYRYTVTFDVTVDGVSDHPVSLGIEVSDARIGIRQNGAKASVF